MRISCVIVDDEQGAQSVLQHYISKLSYVELLGTFSNAIEAYHFLKNNKTDLILLDVNMPEVTGFGLLDMLTDKPIVIFTTAYSNYALKGFDYHAVDYLHKPIRFERFAVAMEKALKWRGTLKDADIVTVTIKVDGIAMRVRVSDIIYIESIGNYVKIITSEQSYITHMTTSDIEQILPKHTFIRVHKSYIVNAMYIKRHEDSLIRIADGIIPIGKTYKKYFTEFMKNKKTTL